MTSHEIALTLMSDRYRRCLCIPRYTPNKWFECDVMEITDAGYWKEYEIKTSRADFFADVKKMKAIEGLRDTPEGQATLKHNMLAAGDARGPSNFTFVIPAGLVKLEEIPEWAGLIEVTRNERAHTIPYRLSFRRIKDGRRLHTEKASEQLIKHAKSVCYYRMHDLMVELARVTAKKSPTKDPSTPEYEISPPVENQTI